MSANAIVNAAPARNVPQPQPGVLDDGFALWRDAPQEPARTATAPAPASNGHSATSASATTTTAVSRSQHGSSGEGTGSDSMMRSTSHQGSSESDDAPQNRSGSNTTGGQQQQQHVAATDATDGAGSLSIIAERFKTKLCKKFEQTGHCPYTSKCMFAHGERELRTMEQNMEDGVTNQGAVYALRRRMAKEAKQQRSGASVSTPVPQTQQPSTSSANVPPQQATHRQQQQQQQQQQHPQPLQPQAFYPPMPAYPPYHQQAMLPPPGSMPGYGGYMAAPPMAHPGYMPAPLPYAWPGMMPPPQSAPMPMMPPPPPHAMPMMPFHHGMSPQHPSA